MKLQQSLLTAMTLLVGATTSTLASASANDASSGSCKTNSCQEAKKKAAWKARNYKKPSEKPDAVTFSPELPSEPEMNATPKDVPPVRDAFACVACGRG